MGRINRLTPTTTLSANSVIAMDAESGGATNKVTIQTLAAGLRSFGDYATQAQLAAKQDVLTFDDAPEEDSDNPVTSGGIYNAIGSAMSNVYTKAETDNAIAQSTAGGAGYFKSQDGTLIQWGKHTFNPSSTSGTQRGNLYFYECKNRISFPIAFTATPAVTINKAGGQMASVGWTSITYSGIEEVDFLNGLSSISASDVFTVDWVAFGRWK